MSPKTGGFVALLALAGRTVGNPMPQAVTESIAPEATKPSECSEHITGKFVISPVDASEKSSDEDAEEKAKRRAFRKRGEGDVDGLLECKLKDSILKDQADRTGYIASNYQFQFDGPPQSGALYTAGFSVCENGSIALGGSALFYECNAGGYYNLYDRHWAEHCEPIYLVAKKTKDEKEEDEKEENNGKSEEDNKEDENDEDKDAEGEEGKEDENGEGEADEEGEDEEKEGDGDEKKIELEELKEGEPVVTEIAIGQPKAPEKSGEAEQGGEEATKVEGGAATTKAAETVVVVAGGGASQGAAGEVKTEGDAGATTVAPAAPAETKAGEGAEGGGGGGGGGDDKEGQEGEEGQGGEGAGEEFGAGKNQTGNHTGSEQAPDYSAASANQVYGLGVLVVGFVGFIASL